MSEALAARRWIVSPTYDLTLFFGGAVASLTVLALLHAGVPILVLWWCWLLGFDGPHIAAAFTRTYLDREEWRRRKGLLLGSLGVFAVGPACLVLGTVLGSPVPFQLFLGGSVLYGYYHVVRQHYGFLALYKAVEREDDAIRFRLETWSLYVGCWASYLYLLLTHPRARVLLPMAGHTGAGTDDVFPPLLVAVWVLCLAAPMAGAARPVARSSSVYVLSTLLLYGLTYFMVARAEPVYSESSGPDQDFLLVSILVTMFHNIQYLGLVWFHNRNRYAGEGDFGPARGLARAPLAFVAGCLAFSFLVYSAFACSTGVFPGCIILPDSRIGPFSVSQLGLCLWWGLALHHYVLDQRIWRVRSDPSLRTNLGLA